MSVNLFRDTGNVVGWTFRVLRRFASVSRSTIWANVACLAAARITHVLTFLLPLKIILLAGSNGVPRYFRFFISPEHREVWIISLSIAAVASYGLTLLLETRSSHLSEKGSAGLLAASGVMSVVANQRVQAQDYYAGFAQIAAALLFGAVALLGLALLNPVLALYITGLLTCFYLLTAWAIHGVTPLKHTRLSDFVTERLGSYLGILSAVAFLSSFLVILYPFASGAGGNILVAIVSFVLARQVLRALSGSIKDAISLAQKRPIIDTLVFPEHRLQVSERKAHRTLRELFGRQERERLVAAELKDLPLPGQSFRVEWRDPQLRGGAEFDVTLEGGDHPARHFRQGVFPPRFRHMVENEDLLFSHVKREVVWAPPVERRFFHGEHECLVWDGGTGRAPARKQWRAVEDDFFANLWSFEPPSALRKIYASSHSFLHQRLTDELVARLDIGADSNAEAASLKQFRDALPTLRETLAGMPLRLVNPDFRRDNVSAKAEGGFHVLGWGQWSLEPVGAGARSRLPASDDRLAAILKLARNRSPATMPDFVSVHHLMLARRCSLLEVAILRGAMKAGLALARQAMADHASSTRTPALTVS